MYIYTYLYTHSHQKIFTKLSRTHWRIYSTPFRKGGTCNDHNTYTRVLYNSNGLADALFCSSSKSSSTPPAITTSRLCFSFALNVWVPIHNSEQKTFTLISRFANLPPSSIHPPGYKPPDLPQFFKCPPLFCFFKLGPAVKRKRRRTRIFDSKTKAQRFFFFKHNSDGNKKNCVQRSRALPLGYLKNKTFYHAGLLYIYT